MKNYYSNTNSEEPSAMPVDFHAALTEEVNGLSNAPLPNAAEPYTTRGLLDIARMDLAPKEYIWNGMTLSGSPSIAIYGSPARGKSRFVQALARHQILGRPFGGIPTLPRPLTWLYIGSENSAYRTKEEANRFLFGNPCPTGTSDSELPRLLSPRGLTMDDARLLDRHFKAMTLEGPEDRYISIGNKHNRERFVKTFQTVKPDVVVWDPWGDVVVDGKDLDDSSVRETIRLIRECEARATPEHMPANIFVAHSRMGAQAEANARGIEAGNYGKNSKALFSIVRFALNIRAASDEENPPIEIICAKNNDGVKPPPLALRLNADVCDYELIPDFDHVAWQKRVDAAARGKGSCNQNVTRDEMDQMLMITTGFLKEARDLPTNKELTQALQAKGVRKNAAECFLSASVLTGSLAKTNRLRLGKNGDPVRDGNRMVYGTPEMIDAYTQRWHSNLPNFPTGRLQGAPQAAFSTLPDAL